MGVSTLVIAQTDVYLKLNQKLDGNAFGYSNITSNNFENAHSFTRLQYYISQVTLTYNGGQDTLLADTYFLIDADQPFEEMLGSFNFSSLESISFGIGVDASKNHADPSTYATGHALGFHSPSMHWGWSAGYRFAVLEGNTDLGQGWQLHALGDKNYGFATIMTSGQVVNNNLVIALDANYEAVLDDIVVNTTLNYHGEDNQAPVTLGNFQNKVFTAGDATFDVEDYGKIENAFSLMPNPTNGDFEVKLNLFENEDFQISVRDITGREVSNTRLDNTGRNALNLKHAGVYTVSLLKNGQLVNTQKLVVK